MAPMFERLGKDELTLDDVKRMQERFGGGQGGPGGRGGMGRSVSEMLTSLKSMDANQDGQVTLDEVPEEAKPRVEGMLEPHGP